ncbi:MAG: hypothetical protein PHD06_03070 [Bacteroidales bacterium]|jgi:hypothetical protein|nr:hypothetical protein [Bacteroidales bacterium]MDY0198423.1 hypothetical protein [Tenuifilaceae bacterium]
MKNDRRIIRLELKMIERFENEEMLMIKGGSIWTWIKDKIIGNEGINPYNCANCYEHCGTNNGC